MAPDTQFHQRDGAGNRPRVRFPGAGWYTLLTAVAVPGICFAALLFSAGSVSGGGQNGRTEEPDDNEVRRTRLIDSLVHDGEQSRIFSLARAELQSGRHESAAEYLRRILSADNDAFILEIAGPPESLRAETLRLLAQAPPEFHRVWQASAGPAGVTALKSALHDRDRSAIRRVAESFPLTEAGFQAHLLSVTLALQTEDPGEVEPEIHEFSERYRSSRFAGRAANAVAEWSRAVERWPATSRRPSARTLQHPFSLRSDDAAVTRPWPLPNWTWMELPSQAPPGTASLIAACAKEIATADRDGESFRSWCVVPWQGLLILRSPVRIAAIRPADGTLAWQIATDTLPEGAAAASQTDGDLTQSYEGLSRIDERLMACGMIAADDDLLCFLDGYSVIPAVRFTGPDPLNQAAPEPRNSVLGHRLVAVAAGTDGRPEIAWTAGRPAPKPYQVGSVTGATADSSSTEADELPVLQNTDRSLDEHFFYSLPTGQGSRVFVLTVAYEQVWLNCLRKSDGRLLWQQPVCMKPESLTGVDSGKQVTAPPGFLVQTPDSVICCIPDGPVIRVSKLSGSLKWATTVEDSRRATRLRRFAYMLPQPITFAEFTPVVSADRLIVSSADSGMISCLSASSGEVLWRSSRIPRGRGMTPAAADQYAAGIAGSRVVLIGDGHCRALDIRTGEQLWYVPIEQQSGRAIIDDRVCLVPERSDSLALISLDTGSVDRISSDFQPDGTAPMPGSVALDDRFVYVSTPVSVSQFPRADVLATADARETGSAIDPLMKAQAVRLAFGRDAALDLLVESAFTTRNGIVQQRFHEMAAELILQDLGSRVFQEAGGGAERTSADSDRNRELLAKLQRTPGQRIRSRLLELLMQPEDNRFIVPAEELSGSVARAWVVPQSMDGDWLVRPDLLLTSELRRRGIDAAEHAAWTGQLDDSAGGDILRAGRSPATAEDLQQVRTWNRHGNPAVAEALAVALLRHPASAADADVLQKLLRDIRRSDPLRTIDETAPDTQTAAEDASTRDAGTSRGPVDAWVIRERSRISELSSVYADVINGRILEHSTRLPGVVTYLHESFTEVAIRAADLKTGAVLDGLSPGFRIDFPDSAALIEEPCGLIPLTGAGHLGVAYHRSGGQLELLWKRRIGDGRRETGVKRIGPLGPDYLVWQSENRLHCTHPVTGQELWSRKATFVDPGGLVLSFPMLFGDETTTMLVDGDQQSCQRYSTRDGRYLGTLDLGFDRTQNVTAVGRRLVGVRSGSLRLSIQDLADGREILDPSQEIQLAGDSTFRRLPSGRIVAITQDRSIVVIDPRSGEVVMRTTVAGTLNTDFVFGFIAFERAGRLLVAINDERGFGESISAPARLGEPRCEFGRLFCLNPEAGTVEWTRRMDPAVLPEVHGADLLVAWSLATKGSSLQRRPGRKVLRIQLIDLKTGHLTGSADNLTADIPVCVRRDERSGELIISGLTTEFIATPAWQPPPLQ